MFLIILNLYMPLPLLSDLAWRKLPLILGFILIFFIFQTLQNQVDIFSLHLTHFQLNQSWRIISGHLVHSNFLHFILNSAGFLALWALHGHFYQPVKLIQLVLLSCLFISAWLFFFSDIDIYYGFSGILHTLVCWGALKDIQAKDKTGYLLLLALAAKVFYEQSFGASESTEALIGVAVATQAHLAGAIFGAIYFYIGQFNQCKKIT
ncbi:rhombosortase [Catenovulum sp. 2E275]|uniref:rhombosortase n=1 Tax=Catenovulum sp. 2E275 TaxID=2980497 RepID=UPI0021D284E3|nr:rhombosortase [Catenovulum sp. 2E275]MCU4676722.1 rhombosortase [Catenovulum sp. 2E275]